MKVIIAIQTSISPLFLKQQGIFNYQNFVDVIRELCKEGKLKLVSHTEDGDVIFNTVGKVEEIGVKKR